MKCPYCAAAQGRCATTSAGRFITECISCGRVVEERQSQSHHLFHIRAQDSPLCLVTSDLPALPNSITDQSTTATDDEEDPFEPSGFITAFSTWSLEPYPVFAQSSLSFAGHLAELERVLETTSSSSSSGPSVVVDNLRAYLQIIDVASILGLDCDITDHAFQLFRDCSSATCLRNRSVEALATAALVQAIREAQEPRTLQEISIAANLPQKEIGKYIKILGEALQLSQPLNSNSISVHMPRFCTLLQLNKSAQELATHIGEVVINKCFCTRRNPISISAAAIYLASQLEDKRKTQAEICKVTGLTEVTLRKVYKELLENWNDLLPSNYTPAIPPEKAFPTAMIASGRSSSTPRIHDGPEADIKLAESRDGISDGNGNPWKFQSQNATNTQEIDIDGGGVNHSEELEKKGGGGGNRRFWPPAVSSSASPGTSQAIARSMQTLEVPSVMGPRRSALIEAMAGAMADAKRKARGGAAASKKRKTSPGEEGVEKRATRSQGSKESGGQESSEAVPVSVSLTASLLRMEENQSEMVFATDSAPSTVAAGGDVAGQAAQSDDVQITGFSDGAVGRRRWVPDLDLIIDDSIYRGPNTGKTAMECLKVFHLPGDCSSFPLAKGPEAVTKSAAVTLAQFCDQFRRVVDQMLEMEKDRQQLSKLYDEKEKEAERLATQNANLGEQITKMNHDLQDYVLKRDEEKKTLEGAHELQLKEKDTALGELQNKLNGAEDALGALRDRYNRRGDAIMQLRRRYKSTKELVGIAGVFGVRTVLEKVRDKGLEYREFLPDPDFDALEEEIEDPPADDEETIKLSDLEEDPETDVEEGSDVEKDGEEPASNEGDPAHRDA